jgi:hypothetical protein
MAGEIALKLPVPDAAKRRRIFAMRLLARSPLSSIQSLWDSGPNGISGVPALCEIPDICVPIMH